MTKFLVTFEVDNSQLFDTLHKMNGDCASIGQRLAETLLTPEHVSTLTFVGMGMYGIRLASVKRAETPPKV